MRGLRVDTKRVERARQTKEGVRMRLLDCSKERLRTADRQRESWNVTSSWARVWELFLREGRLSVLSSP